MPSIFLSYRRADTGGYAGRLTDSLARHFGKGNVFQDLEAIVPGSDFTRAIDAAIAQCQVLVVLIGDTWLAERAADGSPRLEDPHDFVRLEIASGLRAATHVIPVLVEGAKMPAESALPDDLKPLARLQALELSDTRWEYDVDRLAKVVRASPGVASSRRRTYLLAGSAAAVLMLAVVAGYFASDHTPQIAGQWMLPNGSFWFVLQNGGQLAIEETHYESKQVWKRGTGTLEKQRVTFNLETIYGPAHREDGTLALSADRSTLSGTITGPAGTGRLALTRR
jgi:hypothetical protein